MTIQDPIEWVDANGLNQATSKWACAEWNRDAMRPFSKAVALQRNDGVNKTFLWNAKADQQRQYVFEGKLITTDYTFPHAIRETPVFEDPTIIGTEPNPIPIPASNGNGEHAEAEASDDDLLEIIRKKLGTRKTAVDESMLDAKLAALKAELLGGMPKVKRVEIKRLDGTVVDVGIQHKTFPTLLAYLSAGVHVALVGPAGGGKTHAVHQAALALGKTFDAISVGPQTTQSQIMGYMDATGKYVSTAFRRQFETGNIVLLDEFDAANAGVGTCVNAATANSGCGFPDGYVQGGAGFGTVLAMNTFGNGADRVYVGRNQLDGATMDRFVILDWDYDEELEKHLSGNIDWAAYVQKVRKAVFKLQLRHVVSPRASINGAKLLKAGVAWNAVEQSVLWKGMSGAEKAKVIAIME